MLKVRSKSFSTPSVVIGDKIYNFQDHHCEIPDQEALDLVQANSDYEVVEPEDDSKGAALTKFDGRAWNTKKKKDKKLIWDGPIGYNNGYGKSSMMMAEGLGELLDLYIVNSKWLGSIHEHMGKNLEKLMKKKTDKIDTFYIKFFPASVIENRTAERFVAYTMLETTRIPKSWVKKLNKYAERVIVPSEHQRQAFIDSGVTVDIRTIPLGLKTDMFPVLDRTRPEGETEFVFGTMGSLTYRKGTDILVKAFLKAFPLDKYPNVGLIIKTLPLRKGVVHNWFADPELLRKDPRIVIVGESYSPDQLLEDFFKIIDAFVFPTRGEGFGLPPLEAMCTGLPTLCTNWSGCSEFLDPKVSIPLDYELKPVPNGKMGGYPKDLQAEGQEWAEVDPNYLAEKMLWVYENQDKAKKMGAKAAKYVRKNFNHKLAAQKVIDYLDEKF